MKAPRRAVALLIAFVVATATTTAGEAHADDAAPSRERPLSLIDVLGSVSNHYPLLAAVLEEQALADARLLSKQGAFDLRLGAGGKLKPEGFYETYEGDVFVEQPTTLWGADLFGGYRIGSGDFAVWNGGDETNDGGEFRLGFRLPLLRNRAIDSRRAALRKAEIEADAADPIIRESVIDFSRTASFAYWEWVASGMRVGLARQLVDLAEERQSQLSRRVERGALPAIDLTDNERLIVDREVRFISAERAFEQAAIDLSLFLRDDEGQPLTARVERVPSRFPEEDRPEPDKLEEDIARAFEQQPLLQELAFLEEKAALDLALAENRLLPEVAISVTGSQDIGGAVKNPDDKGPTVLEAGIKFDLPLQRREAKGEVAAARARLRQIQSQQKYARDRIAADVKNAVTALRAAYDQVSATRKNLELAQRLRKAEERKLLLGTSNLINVNIRELQAFDAAATLIATQADYFRALANFRAALGETDAATALSVGRPDDNG